VPDDRGAQRGSAVVEFALVLPLILVLALALVQIGVLARDELMVVQAARAGAREAAVTADAAAVREAAERSAAGLERASMDVEIVRGGALGEPVSVEVAYAAPVTAPLVAWLFPSIVSLSASAVARQEFG
jgi:Flp pilus assembly protein TadG